MVDQGDLTKFQGGDGPGADSRRALFLAQPGRATAGPFCLAAPGCASEHAFMAEYGTLLQDLTNNITLEDLEQLKSACKEDIPVSRVRRSLPAVPGLASWRATISWTKTASLVSSTSLRSPAVLTSSLWWLTTEPVF